MVVVVVGGRNKVNNCHIFYMLIAHWTSQTQGDRNRGSERKRKEEQGRV